MDSGHVENVWVQVTCDIHRHRPFYAGPFDSRVPGCGVHRGRLVSCGKMLSSRLFAGKRKIITVLDFKRLEKIDKIMPKIRVIFLKPSEKKKKKKEKLTPLLTLSTH